MVNTPPDLVEARLKKCASCGFTKPLTEFLKNRARTDGVQTYCALCTRRYRQDNPIDQKTRYARHADANRQEAIARYWEDPDTVRAKRHKVNRTPEEYARHTERVKKRAYQIREAVFGAYGGFVCACCNERNPMFLTIDHIEGCGGAERRKQGLGHSFYGWLRRHGFPPGFQVLCYNCNLGRAKNGGVCPHATHSA